MPCLSFIMCCFCHALLLLMQDLQYDGPTPASRNKASEIIQDIKMVRRTQFLKQKALRRGMDPAAVKGLLAFVRKYNL